MDRQDTRLKRALQAIVAFNREDPQGEEVAYSERMTAWLVKLEPEASEALQIAARAQHIGRWRIPRETYPMDRAGYKRWRTDLAKLHAETTVSILAEAGYDEETIERTSSLLQKKRLKTDPECQTLEDVIALVFLEHYFADFAPKHSEEKIVRILQRTRIKMSPRGHEAALRLKLRPDLAELVEKALAG